MIEVFISLVCIQEVAGLKEDNLSSDTSSSHITGAGDPSSILSESQYTHVHKLFNVTVVLLYTGIADLAQVKRFLKVVINWQDLGLELGLLYPTLTRIKEEQRWNINGCMMEMLAAWLQQQDNVSQVGAPSWGVLQRALSNIEENELANKIDQ